MRSVIIAISSIVIIACNSNQNSKIGHNKSEPSIDSCLKTIYIDWHLYETQVFKDFWQKVNVAGYKVNDSTMRPIIKRIFYYNSPTFYKDTIPITDCKILDSLNIHRIELISSKLPGNDKSLIIVEEWQFKNISSAEDYASALQKCFKRGNTITKPTVAGQLGASLYISQVNTEQYVPEMEDLVKLIDPKISIVAKNY